MASLQSISSPTVPYGDSVVTGPDIVVSPTGDTATDTANYAAAIDVGGWVQFTSGTFKLSGTGTEIGKITKPGKYLGAGAATIFQIQNGTGASTDILRIAPTAPMTQLEVGSFRTAPQSPATKTGRHGINIDLSQAVVWMSKLNLHHIVDGDFNGNTLNGYSVYVTHYTQTDGLFASTIEENEFCNGLYWQDLGDSMNFLRNHFWGKNGGLDIVSCRPGANHTVIEGNNGWAFNKPLLRLVGDQYKIRDNNFELAEVVDAVNNKACVHIVGGNYTGKTILTDITGNTIQTFSGATVKGLLIENAIKTKVSHNWCNAPGGDLYIAASCTGSSVDTLNHYVNGTYTNLGT